MNRAILLIVILCRALAFGVEPLPENLLQHLGAADFKERQKAFGELAEWAGKNCKTALNTLPKLLKRELDPEISARLLKVTEELYLGRKDAYFGVGFSLQPAVVFRKKKVIGVKIVSVVPGNPAAKAGIKRGDIVIALNGEPFRPGLTEADVQRSVGGLEAGKKHKVTIIRKQKKLVIAVRPIVRPELEGDEERRQEEFRSWLQEKLR